MRKLKNCKYLYVILAPFYIIKKFLKYNYCNLITYYVEYSCPGGFVYLKWLDLDTLYHQYGIRQFITNANIQQLLIWWYQLFILATNSKIDSQAMCRSISWPTIIKDMNTWNYCIPHDESIGTSLPYLDQNTIVFYHSWLRKQTTFSYFIRWMKCMVFWYYKIRF